MVQLGFYKGNCPVYKLISWWTKSPYSHVCFIKNNMKIEAVFSGVRKTKIDDFCGKWECDVYDIKDLTQEQSDAIWKLALSKVGCHYDFMGIASIVFRFIKQSVTRYFCSELVDGIIRDATGIRLVDASPSRTTPGMLSQSKLINGPVKTIKSNK